MYMLHSGQSASKEGALVPTCLAECELDEVITVAGNTQQVCDYYAQTNNIRGMACSEIRRHPLL